MKKLVVSGLVKTYRKRRVVDGVNLDIAPGEIVGLLGPNGAGKTTTFYMIVGLISPDDGTVTLGGEDITSMPMYKRARCGISYLPQEASVFRKLTVEENVRSIIEYLDIPSADAERRLDELLSELGVKHLASTKAFALSGGERRRVEIARSLVNSPLFLLLDEPFSGIDPIAVADIQEIMRGLKKKKIGILVTDHNVGATLGICDRAYIIGDGKLLMTGTPEDIVSNRLVREVYLGENFKL